MCFYKSFLKKYCSGLIEDLIFGIVCQISGLGNVSYKIQKLLAFSDQKVLFRRRRYFLNICFSEGFVCNCNFNNCSALVRENSTNSLKVEKRTNQSCKILIDIL